MTKAPVTTMKSPASVAKVAAPAAVHTPAAKGASVTKSVSGAKGGGAAVVPATPAKTVAVSNESHWVTPSKGASTLLLQSEPGHPVVPKTAVKGKSAKPGTKLNPKTPLKAGAKTKQTSTPEHPSGRRSSHDSEAGEFDYGAGCGQREERGAGGGVAGRRAAVSRAWGGAIEGDAKGFDRGAGAGGGGDQSCGADGGAGGEGADRDGGGRDRRDACAWDQLAEAASAWAAGCGRLRARR